MNQTKQPHRISSIARSASLFGSMMVVGGLAYGNKYETDNNQMNPLDGHGGGGSTFFSGGTHAITVTSATATQFELTVSATCNGDIDRMHCDAFFFQPNGALLTTLTTQGPCVGGHYTQTITSPDNSCVPNVTYNVNFFCINQTTDTATTWATPPAGQTATMVCLQ